MSDLLLGLLERYSPSCHEAEAVHFLTDWMRAQGFRAFTDAVGNACGLRGDEAAPNLLLLLGHIDTFPGQIPVRVEEGVVYGRGSVDAKGSLCAFAEATAQADLPPAWRVLVVGAVEEETASSKGAHYIKEAYTPALCIIGEPSGADRLTLGYKGRLVLDYHLEQPMTHTATPQASAGELGIQFWNAVSAWAAKHNRLHEKLFDQVLPSLRDIRTDNDPFTERVKLTFSLRLPPHLPPELALAEIRPLAHEAARLESYGAEKAYQGGKNNSLVRGMLSGIRARGGQAGFVLKTGTSDMNVVGAVWDCPLIAYGPGDSRLDHTPNEHLSLEEYRRAVATLRHFMEHLT
jgi:LysW-gamma-L-lysine carboxypeptidase